MMLDTYFAQHMLHSMFCTFAQSFGDNVCMGVCGYVGRKYH